MSVHSFIAGTPLHVIISLSLIRQLNLEKTAKLKIVDYFSGAKDVFACLSNLNWDYADVDVSLFPNHRLSYLSCIRDRTDYLYLDSDASFQRYIDLVTIKALRPNLKVRVFEDGVGSYRTDLYHGLKRTIFDKIGVGTHLGGSPFTDTVLVFQKERYRSIFPDVNAEIIQIDEPISGTISRLGSDLHRVFGYYPHEAVSHEKCVVYLSGWKVDTEFVRRLSAMEGDTFVKLHPHIKRFDSELGVRPLNGKVPAEIILLDMLNKYEDVVVYHHGSSVEQYIQNSRLTFIRM